MLCLKGEMGHYMEGGTTNGSAIRGLKGRRAGSMWLKVQIAIRERTCAWAAVRNKIYRKHVEIERSLGSKRNIRKDYGFEI